MSQTTAEEISTAAAHIGSSALSLVNGCQKEEEAAENGSATSADAGDEQQKFNGNGSEAAAASAAMPAAAVALQPQQQQDQQTMAVPTEQFGKVYVGPGAMKEAQIIGIGLGKLRASQLDDLHRAEQYAMDQSVKYVMQKQQQARQQHQQKVALYSQALSLMSRIYVGSINFDVFEDQIRDAFSIFGPIKNINMAADPVTNHHKGFCFIEYEVPEAANIARDAMNGRLLGGRNIKVLPVGRQDTMPQAQPIIDMVVNEARQYNRVFVASVHPDISEHDLRSVFMAFGEVTKCQLARHPSGKGHRGFGYIEFKTAESVHEAVEGMNGFDLGGQFLKVGRAVAPPDAINYLSMGSSGGKLDANALPAAAAIAAAEATARINAQEILGIGKTSPGSSSPADRASASPTPPPVDAQSGAPPAGSGSLARPTRRRGFGGFAAGASVPPPAIVQSLSTAPPPQPPQIVQPMLGAPQVQPSALVQPPPVPLSAPQLMIPVLGNAAAPTAAPIQTPAVAALAEEATTATADASADPAIADFYTTLCDDKFAPPQLVQPALENENAPVSNSSKAFDIAQKKLEKQKLRSLSAAIATTSSISNASAPIALPLAQQPVGTAATSTAAQPPQPQQVAKPKPPPPKKEKLDILDRIVAKTQLGTFDASKPASFAPLDPKVAPRDPKQGGGEDDEEGDQLMIGGPDSWYALALREGGTVSKADGEKAVAKGKQAKGGAKDPNAPKRKRAKKNKQSSGPKLNTAQKIAAANLAGALSDQLSAQNAQNDEASLASQEHMQIRGNDARHLLIQKLMRTNRSEVIVLRNMITPEGIDDELEDEIRGECAKYGRVTDVVIVQEEETNSVKIFVRFAEPVQAEEARKAIDGRYFDGRTVSAESYDQTLFDHDDFTG